MSAWLCSENHIGMLAAYLARRGQGGNELINAREIARVFATANLRSLMVRYGDDATCEIFVENCKDRAEYYVFNLPERPPVFWIKQANCLDYQCCEPDDWLEQRAYRYGRQIVENAIRDLPGYDSEPWGVD